MLSEKYVYHGMDITMDVYEKIRSTVELLAESEQVSFEKAFQKFAESSVYECLQNTQSMMWSESAEFLVDEYYRRQENGLVKSERRTKMSDLQEQAIKMIGIMPDDKLEILISIMEGFLTPTTNSSSRIVDSSKRIGIAKGKFVVPEDYR